MLSEKSLRKAAEEINALGIEPPINLKGSAVALMDALKEALTATDEDGEKVIREDDEFTSETQAVLNELAEDLKELEEEEAEEVEEEEEEVKPVTVKGKKPAAPAPKKDKGTGGYTRIDAVCDALKSKKPKTIKDWIQATNNKFVEKGGRINDSESAMMIKYASRVLAHYDIKFPTN